MNEATRRTPRNWIRLICHVIHLWHSEERIWLIVDEKGDYYVL